MKAILFVLLLAVVATVDAQSINVASMENEQTPAALYKKANELLSSGHVRSTKEVFEQVIHYYEQEGRERELSENYMGMALTFALNGDYNESIRYHKKALQAHHRYRAQESDEDIVINLALVYQLAHKDKKSKRLLEMF